MPGNTETAENTPGKMIVFASDFTHGLRVFQDVKLIRIKSADYSLLIMEDYFPIIGQVNGRIEFVSGDELVDLGTLKGFYVHRDNEFSLLIKEQVDLPDRREGEGA